MAPLDRRGHTLIELLTVLTVIGILAMIAGPRIDVTRFRIDNATQVLGTRLLAAQRLAVQKGHNVVVAFDATNDRVRVHDDENNNLVIDSGEEVEYESLGAGIRFGRGSAPVMMPLTGTISFSYTQGGVPAVVFYRNGSVSEEGGFYLTSDRAAASSAYVDDARAVQIERSTGRPAWYHYASGGWERGS